MKYLSKEPIVFTPARTADPVKLTKACDHRGRKQILQGKVWRCECGEKISQIDITRSRGNG